MLACIVHVGSKGGSKTMKRAIVLTLCLLTLASGGFAGTATYSISDLGSLGGSYSFAYGIDNTGRVTGISGTPDGSGRAFIWQDGTMTDLGTLGGWGGQGRGICPDFVVGQSNADTGDAHACLWQNGVATDLGTLGGYTSCAYGINAAGQVVGMADADIESGDYHAFSWKDGVMVDLGTLGGLLSCAYNVNSSGTIVGYSSTSDQQWRAVAWQDGVITDLGISGTAYSINDSGDIVGMSYVGWHAFLFSNGIVTDLGTLGGPASYAYDINESRQIVGQAQTPTGSTSACLWEEGTAIDLNSLLAADSGWVLIEATGINDAGQITGWGLYIGQPSAFLLSPERKITVPIDIEPRDTANRIKLSERGFTSVAILAGILPGRSEYFDPADADPSTVTLAGAPVAKDNRDRYMIQTADVNGDRKPDLILSVVTAQMQVSPEDTSAVLEGKTFEGLEITGQDSIVIVDGKKRK